MFACEAYAVSSDTTFNTQGVSDSVSAIQPLVRKSWFTIPMGYYQQETSVALGIVGGYYFPSINLRKISSVSGSVIYTFKNQFMVNLNPRFYVADGLVFLNGNANFRYYPSSYFGVSNGETQLEEPYVSQTMQLSFQPGYFVNDNWQIGPSVLLRGERVLVGEDFEDIQDAIFSTYGDAGWNPYWMSGVGFFSTYDTRDNVFYPQERSLFFKTSAVYYPALLGSSYELTALNVDFRYYQPTWHGQMFAWQVYVDGCLGKEVPFQLCPTVGGADNLRGFRERKYIDKVFFQLQTEYRVPIWKRLKGAIFYSIGDVANYEKITISRIKMSYGGGLRYRLNDARVHLRVDIARTNYGDMEFYITATEAF